MSSKEKTPTDILLNLWKIVDTPLISIDDLFFTFSFELHKFDPENTKKFIDSCIKNGLLKKNEEGMIYLSQTLNKETLSGLS